MEPTKLSLSLVTQPPQVGPQSERSFHGAASSVSSPDDQSSRLYHLQGGPLFQTSESTHTKLQNKLFFFCPDTFETPTTDDSLTLDKIKETLRPKILQKIAVLIKHLEVDFIKKIDRTTFFSRTFNPKRCTKETLDSLLRDVLARKFNNKGRHYPTPFFRDRCLVFTFFVFQYDVIQTICNFFDKHPKNKSHQQEIKTCFFKMCSFTAIKKYIDGTQLKPVLNTSFIKENVIDQATSKNIWEKLNNIKILDSSGYILVPKEDVHHQLTHLDLEPQKKCHVLSVLNSFFSNCVDQHSIEDFLCQNCDFSMPFNNAVFNYVLTYEGFK